MSRTCPWRLYYCIHTKSQTLNPQLSRKPIAVPETLNPKPSTPKPQTLNPYTHILTGPKAKEIRVETFRIDYLIRGPKVEKLSLQPISILNPQPLNPKPSTPKAETLNPTPKP